MRKNLYSFTKKLALTLGLFFTLYESSGQYIVDDLSGASVSTGATSGSFAWCLDNVTAGGTIDFDASIAGGTISLHAVQLDRACTINARTDVTIDGGGAYAESPWLGSVLEIHASNVTVNNLVIQNGIHNGTATNVWEGKGILLADGYTDLTLDNISVTNCYSAGFSTSAWVAAGNSVGTSDITISNSTFSNNGVSGSGDGIKVSHSNNVNISNTTCNSNAGHGIHFDGETYIGGAQIDQVAQLTQAIGVTNSSITGCTTLQNGSDTVPAGGIILEGNSNQNLIQDNVCNENSAHGIWLRRANDQNQILDNTCNDNGTLCTGAGTPIASCTVANEPSWLSTGINISLGGNTGNTIDGNDIDNNMMYGIYLYDNYGQPNLNNIISDNQVTNNLEHGIFILNTNATTISNNYVGTDRATQLTNQGNGGTGVLIQNDANRNEVLNNVIIHNGNYGISIHEGTNFPSDFSDPNTIALSPTSSDSNLVKGNLIGIDGGGNAAGNTNAGILIGNSDNNEIDGTDATYGKNYIGANGTFGIQINNTSENNVIKGNNIGIAPNETTAIGNLSTGIDITDSDNNTIGGSTAGDGNVVSNNTDNGITLNNSNNIDLFGNIVGLDATGLIAMGNLSQGISLSNGSSTNNIGGSGANERNIVGANLESGITLENAGNNNTLRNNYIGIGSDGTTALGNLYHGIDINGSTSSTIVGGSGTNEGNFIANNGNTGAGWFGSGVIIQSTTVSHEVYGNYVGLDATGAAAGNYQDGIALFNDADNNSIGGPGDSANYISANIGSGISIQQGSDDNAIQGNHIGTNVAGTTAIPNNYGIYIDASSGNTIGGADATMRNIISGNTASGIFVNDGDNTIVTANYIGLNINGTVLGNGDHGIALTGGSDGGTIGGNTADLSNVISGNISNGIYLEASLSNTILGNLIGTNTTGTAAIANGANGVYLNSSSNSNIIGGTASTERNIISGNMASGIGFAGSSSNTVLGNYIGMNATGLDSIPNLGSGISLQANSDNNQIGGSNADSSNLISGNRLNGVLIEGSESNTIAGNFIGVDVNGTSEMSNKISGVSLQSGANSNSITDRNIISGNEAAGIWIQTNSNANRISDNYIGTNNTGTTAIPNQQNGIYIVDNSNGNIIGDVSLPNVISGNNGDGVHAADWGTAISALTITENIIGLNAGGTSALANTANGINFEIGHNNSTISNNTISGNGINGILLQGGATSNTIAGNNIGTNATGTAAIGNTEDGIALLNATTNTINGSNVISGNNAQGIHISGASSLNSIQSNNIGTLGDGTTALANTQNGILIEGGSTQNAIGGSGVGNIIAFNGANGVDIQADGSNDNPISQNSMFCNTARGIEENGGGNEDYQNPLPSAGIDKKQGATDFLCLDPTVGTLPTGATVEIFLKGSCSTCGSFTAQGATYIGTATVDASGVFNYNLGITVPQADTANYIYTVTEPGGLVSTSEFSDCSYLKTTCDDPVAVVTAQDPTSICEGDSVELRATYNNGLLFTWYEASAPAVSLNGAGQVADDSIYFAKTAGDYYVLIEDPLGCDSTSATVEIIVDQIPTMPNAGIEDTICDQTTYTLAGNEALVGTGTWSMLSGTGSITDANDEVSDITALSAPDTMTLEWAIASDLGICETRRDTVVIINDDAPTTADAGAGGDICESDMPFNLNANTPTVGVASWQVVSGTGTFSDDASSTSTLSASTGSSVTVRWTIENGVCPASTDDTVINVHQAPSTAIAGTDNNPCTATSTLGATAPTDGSGVWTSLQGTASITSPTVHNSAITGLIDSEVNELRWCVSVTGSVCPVSCDTVIIERTSNAITTITIDDDSPVCEGSSVSFTSTTMNGGTAPTYEWFVNNVSVQGPNATDTYASSTLSSGDSVYAVVVGNDACISDNEDTSVVIYPTIETTPAGSATGPAGTICGDTTSATGTITSSTGTGTWTVAATSTATATLSQAGNNVSISSISPVGDELILNFTVSNGASAVCPDDVNPVTINSTPQVTPSISISGTDEQCENQTIAYTTTVQNMGTATYTWYVNNTQVSDIGSTLSSDTLSENATISVVGTTSLSCVTSNTDSTSISVDIIDIPIAVFTGSDFCQGSTTTLTATTGADAYEWFLGSSSVGTGVTHSTSTPGTYSVVATNSGTTVSCPATSATNDINQVEIDVQVGSDQEFKISVDEDDVTTSITGTSNVNNNPIWTTSSSNASIVTNNALTTDVTLGIGTHEFTLTDNTGTCIDSETLTITVKGTIKIHNAFSPPGNGSEGDGSNDEWVILGLEGFDKYTVKVFNRYGNLIREWEDEYIPWDGKSASGTEFPVGTYWYVVTVPGEGDYAGSLTLMR